MNAFEIIDAIRDDAKVSSDGYVIAEAMLNAALEILIDRKYCPVCYLQETIDMIEKHQERSVH